VETADEVVLEEVLDGGSYVDVLEGASFVDV
jgi:hypothetical protein